MYVVCIIRVYRISVSSIPIITLEYIYIYIVDIFTNSVDFVLLQST